MIDITLHCFVFDQYSKLAAATPIFPGFLLIEKKKKFNSERVLLLQLKILDGNHAFYKVIAIFAAMNIME